MSFLYVSEPNTYVHIEEGQIVAEKPDGLKRYIPLETMEGLVLMGSSRISSRCSVELLEKGIPVTFLSSTGSFYGRLESTRHINIDRQRAQFRKGDDSEFCLHFSKGIVSSKIHNQAVVLRRHNRALRSAEIESLALKIQAFEKKATDSGSTEQLMGYEGSASKLYFEALSILVGPEFKFNGRNRMPPLDPFNSLLSLGYTFLMYEIYTSLVNKGLHPYAGLMHKDRHGHPALASDLMEEWRPVIVDSLVLNAVQSGDIKAEDFYRNEANNGVYLHKPAIRQFILGFEKKIRSEASYLNYIDGRMSFRRAMQLQAGVLAKAIEEDDISLYRPVRIR